MRVTHQLFLLIITLLILVLVGTLYISVNSSRDYLVSQMQAQVDDFSQQLSTQLSPILAVKDRALAMTLIDSRFIPGMHQKIRIKIPGQEDIDKITSANIDNVPDWFISMLRIDGPVGIAQIKELYKWEELGSVEVTVNPNNAYRALWKITIDNIYWMLILAIAALVIVWGIIKLVLNPLHAIEQQAMAIARQDFSLQKTIPKTPEMKRLVTVMNTMSEKVADFVALQARQLKEQNQQLYTDEVTGLMNRRAFDNRFEQLLVDQAESSQGMLILIRAQGLDLINKQLGYQQGNEALSRISEILNNTTNTQGESARISGTDFCIILPAGGYGEINMLCEKLKAGIEQSVEMLNVYLAAVIYRNGQQRQVVLSMADIALSQAMQNDNACYTASAEENTAVPLLTATQWCEKLVKDIQKDAMQLFFQVVIGKENNVLHKEVLLRVTHHGEHISTPAVLSVANRSDLSQRLDRYVLQKVASMLGSINEVIAVNLSPVSLYDEEFVRWLDELLQIKMVNKKQLVLEFNERGLHVEKARLQHVLQKLKQHNIQFAFDGVGVDELVFPELHGAMPEYVKLDARFSLNVNDADQLAMIEKIVSLAHTLSIKVIAQHIESQDTQNIMYSIGVDGTQGFYIGKPDQL